MKKTLKEKLQKEYLLVDTNKYGKVLANADDAFELIKQKLFIEEGKVIYPSSKENYFEELIKYGFKSEKVEFNNIKISRKRTFSVGYSAAHSDYLASRYEVELSYHIYDKAIIKHQSGDYFTSGAYEGYYIDKFYVDGIELNVDVNDAAFRILEKVEKEYNRQ